MKKIVLSAVSLMAIMGSVNTISASESVNVFNNVKVKGEIRPRLESADVIDNGKDGAQALTARTHLSITSGLFDVNGLTSTIGLQSVNNFGGTDYNSKQNGNIKYDVIADPNMAMLSEASLNYKSGTNKIHAGRSQLNLDNQRFIGTVGWRQLERSYDTVSLENNSIKGLNVLAAYLYGYAGVTGVKTTETNSIILHAKYKISDALNITAYDYMIASLSDTYGLALTGKLAVSGAKLTYRAEYAIQSDPTMEYQVANKKADANYMNLDLGANISGLLIGANYELFSGSNGTDGKTNFNPKLGTNHGFNGWADVFFVGNSGPLGGLIDANVRIGYKAKGFGKLLAVYHNFTAETSMSAIGGGTTSDLGSEIDAVYVNKIPGVKGLKGLLKIASYSKGNVNTYNNNKKDKQVAWAQLDYRF